MNIKFKTYCAGILILIIGLYPAGSAYGASIFSLFQGGTGWGTSTTGDLLVGTTSQTQYTRLPAGTMGQVLIIQNGTPQWVATSSLGITGAVTSVFGRTGAVSAQTGDYSAFYPTYGYGTSTYVNFPYASSTFSTYAYGSSTYAFAGSGNLAWLSNGSTLYNATSTNNVSVGTSSSWAKFDILNSVGSTTSLFDVSTTTSSAGATTSLFTVLANGNVGIGVSNPTQLFVASSSSAFPEMLVQGGTAASGVNGFAMANDIGHQYNVGIGGSANMSPTITPNSWFVYDNTASTERIKIDSSGNFTVNPSGSSASSPRIIGFSPAQTSGQALQFQFGDSFNVLQNAYGGRMALGAYWGIEIRGNRETSAPSFDTGGASDPSLTVFGATGDSAPVLSLLNNAGNTTLMTVLGNGQIQVGGATPTFTAGTGAGTSPTITVTGNGNGGVLKVTTGSLPTAGGPVGTLNYPTTCPTNSAPVFSPANQNAAQLSTSGSIWMYGQSTSTVVLTGSTGLVGSTAYVWNYHVTCF